MSLLATPFHARAVEANLCNAWENRRGYTLARHYGSIAQEAVAARFGAVVADVSWQWRVAFSGGDIEAFIGRAFTRNGAALVPGTNVEVLWLNDGGAVRGRGFLLRQTVDRFVLVSGQEDRDWLFAAAALFGVVCNDQSTDGMLTLIGPSAGKILTAAEIGADLEPSALQPVHWRGIEITLARFGLGYSLWCDGDSAHIVWDRLMAAGKAFALIPAGQAALDILTFESGVLTPGRDFVPSREDFESAPTPQALGLCALVDRAHVFNGKAGFLAAGRDTALSGLLMGAEPTIPPTTLSHHGAPIGKILSTLYSPALQENMGFAMVSGSWPSGEVEAGSLPCRVVALPFLPIGLSPDRAGGAALATETGDRPV